MAIAIFRGESSVAEIADKLFVDLDPAQRAKAQAELMKANPQLRNITKLRAGTILHVPVIPELQPRASGAAESPGAQIARDLAQALGDYSKQIDGRFKAAQEDSKAQAALLKSAKFKRLLTDAPELQAIAGDAAKAVDARAKGFGARQKELAAAIKQLSADLEGPSKG